MVEVTFTTGYGKKVKFITTTAKVVEMLKTCKVNHPQSKSDIIIDELIKQVSK
jgi:hypothetical protein